MTRPLVDSKAAAERLGITVRHLEDLVARRELPVIKVGRLNRFDPGDLDLYIAQQRLQQRQAEEGDNDAS